MLCYTVENLEMNTIAVATGFLEVALLRPMRSCTFPAAPAVCYPLVQINCRLLSDTATATDIMFFAVTEETLYLEWFLGLCEVIRRTLRRGPCTVIYSGTLTFVLWDDLLPSDNLGLSGLVALH